MSAVDELLALPDILAAPRALTEEEQIDYAEHQLMYSASERLHRATFRTLALLNQGQTDAAAICQIAEQEGITRLVTRMSSVGVHVYFYVEDIRMHVCIPEHKMQSIRWKNQ